MLVRRAWQLGLCVCACSVFPDRAELPREPGRGGEGGSGGTTNAGHGAGGIDKGGESSGGSLGGTSSAGSPASGGMSSVAGEGFGGGAGGVEPVLGGRGGSDVDSGDSGSGGGSGGSGCSVLRLVPDGDAWISEASPKSNFGDQVSLQVGNVGLDRAEALLSFDLSAIPAGAKVEQAELTLELRTSAGGARLLRVYRVSDEWREAQVTWVRSRAGRSWMTGGGADAVEAPSAFLELAVGTAARTQVSFVVTTDVIDMLTAPNYGWVIREEEPGAARLELTAREVNLSTPALLVTTCP